MQDLLQKILLMVQVEISQEIQSNLSMLDTLLLLEVLKKVLRKAEWELQLWDQELEEAHIEEKLVKWVHLEIPYRSEVQRFSVKRFEE